MRYSCDILSAIKQMLSGKTKKSSVEENVQLNIMEQRDVRMQ